jgi:hypothetical protein
MTGAATTVGPEFVTAAAVSVTASADASAATGVLTTAADDDERSATLLCGDEDATVETDADSAEDADERSALNSVEV